MQISGEMLSIQKLFDRPSTLGVGMGAMSAFDIETSPKERAIHSRPSAFPVTPYHTNRVRDVSVKAVLQDRSNATSVPVTTNTRDTIVLLHEKLKYVTSGFHECIDALAEEHRQTRIWKGEYEKLDRQVQSQAQESRMIEAKNKRFLNKRQGLVNALLPIARPILADHDKWIEEAKKPAAVYVFNNPVKSSDEVNLKHAKREISGKVRVYIPSISTSLYAAKSNVPHFNIAGPKSKIRKQFFGDEKPKSFLNVRKLVAEKL